MSFRDLLIQGAEQRGVALSPECADKMEIHYRLLVHWNRVVLLTSVEGEEEILQRHFLESLEVAEVLPRAGRLVDVGSGNGFPAMPLLLHRPSLAGILLEPAVRKRAFLKEVLRETGLEDQVKVLKKRIERPEDLEPLAPIDVLTVRAVARVKILLRGAAGGLSPGGQALLFVGEEDMALIRKKCPEGLKLDREIALSGRDASFVAVVKRTV